MKKNNNKNSESALLADGSFHLSLASDNIMCYDLLYMDIETFRKFIISKIYFSAKNCYSENIRKVINDDYNLSYNEMANYIKKIIDSGHMSILEHANLTFQIFKQDRTTSLQWVRHRLQSFSQQSLRYTDASNATFRIPKSISQNEKAIKLFNKHNKQSIKLYKEIMQLDPENIEKEDARMVIPSSIETSISTTANLRQWKHVLNERCCFRASEEINKTAWKIRNYLINILPIIFTENDGPKCYMLGYCPEHKSCGHYKKIQTT